MPSTPYHAGPALFFAAALSPLVSFPVFLAASLLPDLEGLLWTLGFDAQQHGLLHSYFGALVIALLLGFVAFKYRSLFDRFELFQRKRPLRDYLFSAVAGAWLHVFIDSLVYADQNPFLPFKGNPLAGFATYEVAAVACVLFALAGLMLYLAEKQK